jgi:hypothetical protein
LGEEEEKYIQNFTLSKDEKQTLSRLCVCVCDREVCNIKINRLEMEDGTELRHMSNKWLQF